MDSVCWSQCSYRHVLEAPGGETALDEHRHLCRAVCSGSVYAWTNIYSGVICYWHHKEGSNRCVGGLLSGILFQYPGAIIMCCVGVFAAKQLENPRAALNGMVAGVSAVGVALVASAAKSMLQSLVKALF